jgi:hypothetical protein
MDRHFRVGADYQIVDTVGEGAYGVVWSVPVLVPRASRLVLADRDRGCSSAIHLPVSLFGLGTRSFLRSLQPNPAPQTSQRVAIKKITPFDHSSKSPLSNAEPPSRALPDPKPRGSVLSADPPRDQAAPMVQSREHHLHPRHHQARVLRVVPRSLSHPGRRGCLTRESIKVSHFPAREQELMETDMHRVIRTQELSDDQCVALMFPQPLLC